MSAGRFYRTYLKSLLITILTLVSFSFVLSAQFQTEPISAPPGGMPPILQETEDIPDSLFLPSRVQTTLPQAYSDYISGEYAADLETPENITLEPVYDPESGLYIIHGKVGGVDIYTPYMMTSKEYNDLVTRKEMFDYFRKRDSEPAVIADKKPFKITDMNFASGPLERVFGPGGIRLTTQGSIQMSMGIKSNKTENPALSLKSRRKTYLNFDQKIQATIGATVGEKLKFDMTYNTDATFDFDSKNLRLDYEGNEDEIIKSIQAGNVSMTTGSSLIRGGTSLFGIKTELQFGKLKLTGLISQQNSESRTVNTTGGVQTTPYSFKADNYDENRHYFLAQYFYDNYDNFASRLPHVSSGINITRIEVWVTNKQGYYDESRNFVGFQDIGENSRLGNNYWIPDLTLKNPSNRSNNLLDILNAEYPEARNINSVTQTLSGLSAYGIRGGVDYEKVESGRLLRSSEYELNSTLGYISLKGALNNDEVLAVAYEYTYNGKVYQVGEFSSDVTSTSDCLYLKMLKATTVSPSLPMWKLMMKNVYSLGAYQLQKNNFKLNIKYLSDTTGVEINYLPIGEISNVPLLQVMNLDRIDSNQEPNSDGFFDYIEGYTVQSANGRIIFPVVEPFGSNLERKIGSTELAKDFVYKELYDSTLVVARQFADKNKFSLEGEYQASSGATVRLNAMNVPRGSVVVMAGGVVLTENSDYTVDYNLGIVTITNQSIIDSGANVSVTLENQSLFNMQRKTLMGFDAQYRFNKDLTIGGTLMYFSEKSLTEKVAIGEERINNTMWGLNINYNKEFLWLTNLLNKIPTINATAPSAFRLNAEFAQILPQKQKSGTAEGSSYIDDFEGTQTGIDLRNPYSWTLASTPYDPGPNPLFPEAGLMDNIDYGKNRGLLAWNYIDRFWTQKNSDLIPGYIRNDLKQLSNPYVREVRVDEIYPGRDLLYGESNYVQTLNLSFYPKERGPYNLDSDNIDEQGHLLYPEKRWGGIMRKMDNPNFEQNNVEYIQFWLLDPFLDPDNPNEEGGDLYINLGEISEDILKDGLKSYENGIPIDGNYDFITTSSWGRVSTQNSLTYAFENGENARILQDVGLDGLPNEEEFTFGAYAEYVENLRNKLNADVISNMDRDPLSPMNDPAGDNYHFYRSNYYDDIRAGILQRYKHYNGVEKNSLSPEESDNPYYQSSRSVPDVEDINQDNTLNEYERYFEYKISLRPEDMIVGSNYITDRKESVVPTREGTGISVWYQFKIPIRQPDRVVGGISDFTTIRFARIFMTGFKEETHLRFASLELVRGEWRDYEYNLTTRNDSPSEGNLDMSIVNIEENSGREPVNYVLPPDVSRQQDPGQTQAYQLNEQSLQMKVTGLQGSDSHGAYKNTQMDLRIYKRIQMWVHAEALIDNISDLKDGDLSIFLRLGTDIKNNYYEYEVPLELTPPGYYNNYNYSDRQKVWPRSNYIDVPFSLFTDLKTERNKAMSAQMTGAGYTTVYTGKDPENSNNNVRVLGNPSLSDVRVMVIGIRNNTNMVKEGIIWVNELRVTDFNEYGGWAANVNANMTMSDIAMLNFSMHKETAGFGGVDQGLSSRRMDNLDQYSFAVQGDAGRLLPSKAKLSAPLYYSRSDERITPRYNPLDQDILLKDALEVATTKQEKDSIKNYSITRKSVESFSLSNLRFNVQSKTPMPWDPGNFQISFSFNKQKSIDPVTEYENTYDYRGNIQYSYSPVVRPWKPFSKMSGNGKTVNFLRDWGINWMFNNLLFFTNISRFYYEEQARSTTDNFLELPVQVSKNFLWTRQLNLTWNLTQSLNFSFSSNTAARIEETIGAVNKQLFPDQYREWKETVLSSIKGLGTPWNYNQVFTASYRAPFNRISFLDYLTANVSYTSNYQWDKGATVEDLYLGNSIRNQSVWNADARLNFETLYNKNKRLQEINRKFSSQSRTLSNQERRPRNINVKRVERAVRLSTDSTTIFRHNLHSDKVNIEAFKEGEPIKLNTRRVDSNTIEILNKEEGSVSIIVSQHPEEEKRSGTFSDISDYLLRFLMMPRNLSFRWRGSHSLILPQFSPNIGDAFGQTSSFGGGMAPGLKFAFGFYDESYITEAKNKGWLLTGEDMTSPAVWNQGKEFNFELTLEPIRGLRIILTSNLTDNRTQQVQFMYENMPTSYSGSYLRTHVALRSALRSSKSTDGYYSETFNRFLEYIPVVANRLENTYSGTVYPDKGFIQGQPFAGNAYNPALGTVTSTSPDVLIPAFIAAYSGYNPSKVTLKHFPGLEAMRPNWRITYDGLTQIGNIKKYFKTFIISHAYQCTYSVGNYTSYLSWVGVGDEIGFVNNGESSNPIPSSQYNISSVAITERFAPLLGVNITLYNDISINAEYRDSRTLSLNTSAGQVVETTSRQFTLGGGWKIAEFNRFLKIGGKQTGFSNDLSVNLDFSLSNNQALIRRIETAYTQATIGTRTLSINLMASYQLSRRITLSAFFDHQLNTPLVSNSSFPMSNSNYGIAINMSLAR